MERLRIAQIEPRSWGDNPRRYAINSFGSQSISVEIDIIKPWEDIDIGYHLFLISDDLCLSKLPFFIPKSQRIALLKESHLLPCIYDASNVGKLMTRFNLILTHHDGLAAADKRFQLVPFSSNMVELCPYAKPTSLPEVSRKLKFCSAVISLGSAPFTSPSLFLRKQVIEYLSGHRKVDLFGKSSNYIKCKADALLPYAFSIAMENTISSSYFTEKLIDCILTGAIPIYHGSRSVLNYFDQRGILFFDSLAELKVILSNLTPESYLSMREFAVINFEKAIHLRFADYHGYLHRACDAIASAIQATEITPFRINTSLFSRLKAEARHRSSFFIS